MGRIIESEHLVCGRVCVVLLNLRPSDKPFCNEFWLKVSETNGYKSVNPNPVSTFNKSETLFLDAELIFGNTVSVKVVLPESI